MLEEIFLIFTEGGDQTPVKGTVLRQLVSPDEKKYLVVRFETPREFQYDHQSGARRGYSIVGLTNRYAGEIADPIRAPGVTVNVVELICSSPENLDNINKAQQRLLDIAALFPHLESAASFLRDPLTFVATHNG